MFATFMINAWEAGTLVALVAGVVGFFTVVRGSAFAAHAIPNSAFAGAAGASLIGANAIAGLAVFSLLGAFTIAGLGRRARHDVATALALVMMLGLGALFLSLTSDYAPEIYALLFGEVLGVNANQLVPTAVIGAACILGILGVYRPLMLTSVMPDVAEARGVSGRWMEVVFLIVVAMAATVAVPVVGALLIFSLLISPAAAATSISSRPSVALALSVLIAVGTVWSALALSYESNLPIGFFVGSIGAMVYAAGRGWAWWRSGRHGVSAHFG
jgi:zinc/manganese transport system permease protein